ncbi:MAG: hypothetical protein ABI330_10700, partial [Caldimonas sp.]
MSEPRPPSAASPDERDAWLSQALRHAPDAAAGPPHALREAILAEARSAVQPLRDSSARDKQATQATLTERVAAFWSWLARPPVAAGFASVMAATLVGLMWWDRPMDESMTSAPPATHIVRPDVAALPPAAPVTADAPASPSPADALPAAHAPPAPSATATRRANAPRAEPVPAGVAEEKQRKHGTPARAVQAVPSISPFPGNDKNRSESEARNQLVGPDQAAAPELAKKSEAEAATTASTPRLVAAEPSGGAAPAEQTRSAGAATAEAKNAGTVGAAAKASPLQRERAAVSSRAAADALDSRAALAP